MKVSKESVNFRKASVAGKSCSSCDMFQPTDDKDCNSCSLVRGCILRDTVCDRWERK